jgi:hypothetical protein
MTPHQIIGFSVRLFAIWFALQGAPYLLTASNNSMPYGTSGAYALGGFFVGVAVLLWFFPMTVAHRLMPRGDGEANVTDKPKELVMVALIVTGIALIAVRGPHLLWYVLRWFLVRVSGIDYLGTPIAVTAELLVTLAQVVGGFVLVSRAAVLGAWMTPGERK